MKRMQTSIELNGKITVNIDLSEDFEGLVNDIWDNYFFKAYKAYKAHEEKFPDIDDESPESMESFDTAIKEVSACMIAMVKKSVEEILKDDLITTS